MNRWLSQSVKLELNPNPRETLRGWRVGYNWTARLDRSIGLLDWPARLDRSARQLDWTARLDSSIGQLGWTLGWTARPIASGRLHWALSISLDCLTVLVSSSRPLTHRCSHVLTQCSHIPILAGPRPLAAHIARTVLAESATRPLATQAGRELS